MKKLRIATLIIVIIWIIAQFGLVIYYWKMPLVSDCMMYVNSAVHCYQEGLWYPSMDDVQGGVVAPAFINYLILHIYIFGSTNFVPIFNILLNLLIAYEIYFLANKAFNQKVALISVILYSSLSSNLLLPVFYFSEIPFMVLILGSVCLCTKKKILYYIFAGILLVLANSIRPVALIFGVSILAFMIIKKCKITHILALVFTFIIAAFCMSGVNYTKNGNFKYTGNTGGPNLIMSCNDDNKGYFCPIVFQKGKIGYLENKEEYNSYQRDSIYRERAISWVVNHPGQFIRYIPRKMMVLWISDYYCGLPKKDDSGNFKYVIDNDKSVSHYISRISFNVAYYFILFFFMVSLFSFRKSFKIDYLIYLLPLIFGIGMSMILYASFRYHYVYMPIIIVFASHWIDRYCDKRICSQ
jgi:hypothetical protein